MGPTSWKNRTLRVLKCGQYVIGEDTYRCPHLRFARNALESLYRHRRDEAWNELLALFRAALQCETPPLRGIAWLLNTLRFAFAWGRSGTVIDDEIWSRVTDRCWATESSVERQDAALALDAIAQWREEGYQSLAPCAVAIGQWINQVDGDCAFGVATLLNSLINHDEPLFATVCCHSRPELIAGAFAGAEPSEGYSWGYLLSRLSFAPEDWRRRLKSALDVPALYALVEKCTRSDIMHLSEISQGIAGLDTGLSLEIAEKVAPIMADALTAAPSEAFRDSRQFIRFVLGYAPGFLRRNPPRARQRRVARCLVKAVHPDAIARAISASRRRDWEVYGELLFFTREVMPSHARSIVKKIDFDALDKATKGQWGRIPGELRHLIAALATAHGEPVCSWIDRHKEEFVSLDPVVAAVAPHAAVTALHRGVPLDLRNEGHLATVAVPPLAKVDEKVAIGVLKDNILAIAGFLSNVESTYCGVVPRFLDLLEELSPATLERVLQVVEPAVAEKKWAERLRGRTKEREAVAALLNLIPTGTGKLNAVADRLRKRFPRATAYPTKKGSR